MKIDRKSTRLNSSHTVIYTLSLHDALPIYQRRVAVALELDQGEQGGQGDGDHRADDGHIVEDENRSEEHTSELQSHRDLHSFPTRRSSDLPAPRGRSPRTGPRRTGRAGRWRPPRRRWAHS